MVADLTDWLERGLMPALTQSGFARAAPARHYAGMIGLSDTQLGIVMDAARTLPVEKRDLYLQRIAAMLTMRGRGHFGDSDVADVTALTLRGLVHTDAA
jgi:hypothetical protein